MRGTSKKFRELRQSRGASALAIRAAAARGFTLPLQAVASIATAGILIRHYGAESYAEYALIVSLVAVLPFADLGIGASVVNATSDMSSPLQREQATAVVTAALRALILVAAVASFIAFVITLSIGWSSLLGNTFDSTGNASVFLCIALFSCTLPISLGQRVALGIGANDKQLLLQAIQPILTLCLALVCVTTSATIQVAFMCFFVSYLASMCLIAAAADRWSGGLIRAAFAQLLRRRSSQRLNVSIFSTALPMCVIYIGLPLVLQTHRLMLSHFGTSSDVAQYSLAAQMFLPVIAVISAASTSLWSIFARERSMQAAGIAHRKTNPMRYSAYMAAAALALCAGVTAIAPAIAPLISDHQISVDFSLGLSFSVFVVAQAAQIPLGVYLTSVPGLRLQAVTTLAFVPAVWILTSALLPHFHAGAPTIATGLVGLVVQIFPFMIAIRLLTRSNAKYRNQAGTN